MPPHCDSMSGPVVGAAKAALAARQVELVLPYVPRESEDEVSRAFARVLPARAVGREAAEVAEQWFFETVVRLHRAGEGAPFTGLKPAGTDVGPVLPLAEKAVESGSADQVLDFLLGELGTAVRERLAHVRHAAGELDGTVAKARDHVEAALDFEVYCHSLHQAFTSSHAAGHHGLAHGED